MQWRRHLWHLIIIVITITTATISYSALIICQSLFQGPPASQQEKIGQKLGFPITTIFIINSKVSEGRREKPDNFIFYLPQIQRIMMVQCSLFNSGIDYSNEITSHRIRTDSDIFLKKDEQRKQKDDSMVQCLCSCKATIWMQTYPKLVIFSICDDGGMGVRTVKL